MRSLLTTLALVALFALPAGAQTVTVNPNTVEFTASANHSDLGLDGAALVTRYEMRTYTEANQSVAVTTVDLGKPTPDATLKVSLNAAQIPTLWNGLAKNVRYIAKVAAIGPSGEAVSDPSNPFGFSGPPAKPGVPAALKK